MPRSPDDLIRHLRNRKRRTIVFGVMTLVLLAQGVSCWLVLARCLNQLVPKESDDLLFHAVMGQMLLPGIATLITMSLLFAIGLGWAAGNLFDSLRGLFTKDDLLVELWDRLQALESAAPQGQTTIP